MKNVFIYLCIICVTQSCKSQDTKKPIYNSDVRIFSFIDKNVFAKNEYVNIDGKLVLHQNKNITPSPKVYTFYQNKDTMSIKCFCNYENNIFIDSITFKKGDYEINIIKFLKGNQPRKLPDFLDSNLFEKYRDLYFYRISFNDTSNINLKKK